MFFETHTHTHIYIYIYIYMFVCLFRISPIKNIWLVTTTGLFLNIHFCFNNFYKYTQHNNLIIQSPSYNYQSFIFTQDILITCDKFSES